MITLVEKTMHCMGHTTRNLSKNHDDELATGKQAAKYFNIRSARKRFATIISMGGAE
jgi:hypothetical protein